MPRVTLRIRHYALVKGFVVLAVLAILAFSAATALSDPVEIEVAPEARPEDFIPEQLDHLDPPLPPIEDEPEPVYPDARPGTADLYVQCDGPDGMGLLPGAKFSVEPPGRSVVTGRDGKATVVTTSWTAPGFGTVTVHGQVGILVTRG